MKKNITLIGIVKYLILFFPAICLASGNGTGDTHHAKVTDLIPSLVNFSILLGFLFFKVRKILKEYFYNYSHAVQSNVERAESKSKEAHIKYEMFDKKIKESHLECENIRRNVENDYLNYTRNFKHEMQRKAEKLRAESIQRLEREKAEYLQKLNEEFLDSIIGKATTTIDASKDIQSKVTKKILKAI